LNKLDTIKKNEFVA